MRNANLETLVLGGKDMNDYLQHHGILGQKWGVRRYQNPDGSLTKAGQKRYAVQVKKGRYDEINEAIKNKVDGSKVHSKYIDMRKKELDMVRKMNDLEDKEIAFMDKHGYPDKDGFLISGRPMSEKNFKYISDLRDKQYELQRQYKKSIEETRNIWTETDKANRKFVEELIGEYGNKKVQANKYRSVRDMTNELISKYTESKVRR